MHGKTTGWLDWKQDTSYKKQAKKPFGSLENRLVIPQNQCGKLLDGQKIGAHE